MKISAQLLMVAALATVPGSAQDFRQAKWGMTKAQVLASEAKRPSDVHESKGEVVIQYDGIKFGGLDSRVVYIFAPTGMDAKLVRAKYLFDAEHSELNDFIADYRAVETSLRPTYGEPTWQKADWLDDALQEERKGYLDQDRALAESILPSDANVGLAVSLGHLKLYTESGTTRTKVLHALTGADGRITHQIEYRSLELGAFEDEVRRQGGEGSK